MDSGDFAGTERFHIAARLGAGGMGIVYKAFDREHGTHVALKTLARLDARDLLRFKAEFRALSDVRHPNLVSFGELFESTGRWFFTMELIDGVDFRTWVTDASWLPDAPTLVDNTSAGSSPGTTTATAAPPRFDEPRLRAALALAARGLAALHGAGKVHRDIKPSNVMVTPEGRVVILDFGLVTDALPSHPAHHAHHAHPSLDTQIAGTVAYMSPEQAASKAVGPEADWYSLGVMLYEILTGRLPHTGAPLEILMNKQRVDPEPPRKVAPGVPEDLDRLCMGLLRFEPSERPRQEEILRRLAVERASELTISRSSSSEPAAVFIGREQALGELARRFQDTRRRKPSTLCVVGESGVGKSALVRHFTQTVQQEVPDTVVLSGRCYETEWVPFKALDGVIDALSSYLSRIPRADAAALLPRHAALLAQVFPVLRRVDVIAQAPNPLSDALPPQELRTHVFAAVRELFARLADRRPLILTIDDLQWADTDSMALLREVLREPDAPELLLLLTARPGPASAPFETLPLAPLPPDEARDLAQMLLGARRGDDAATIAGEAGGHPLFIQELVRHRQTVGGEGPAPRLDEALGARIARLDAAARRLLEVICLAGGPIGQELSAHAAELELSAFARQVSVLRVASMVRTTGTRGWDRVEPYHDRIREAVVTRLDAPARRALHRRLALAFEGSATPDPEMLVLHWQGAGELVVAARHAVAAARRASESLAFDRAARFYRIALDLGPRGAGSSPRDTPARELWELLADALASAGRGGEAAAAYFAATEDANQAEALDLRRRGAEQLLRSGHVDEGLEAIARVLEAVDLTMPRTPRRALAALLARRAQIAFRGLSFAERDVSTIPARELARVDVCWAASTNLGLVDFIIGAYFQSVSLMLALRAGDPARVVRALAAEATYSSAAGGPSRKRTAALVEKTRVLAERLGDPYSKAWVKLASGASAALEGRWNDGRDGCLEAEQMFRDECTGGAWEITTVRWFGALSIAYTGDLATLTRRVHEALRQADDRGDLYATVGQSTGQPNLVWLVADDPAQGRARLRDAMARWSRRDTFHVEHWWAMQADAHIDLYAGDGKAATAGLAARWSGLERSLIMRCQLTRIEAWSVRGRASLVANDLRAAEADARRIARERMAWSAPVVAMLRAGIAAARGDDEKASTLLTSAVPGFEAANMALHAAIARRRLGALRGGERGRELVAAADAWLAGQGVRRPDRFAALLAPGFRE
ncbi:MAG TPA: AAA family ATPase [Kofleriaceae bacterium]|nr:AAA family ATPase [Kofleriaceae bacterium]